MTAGPCQKEWLAGQRNRQAPLPTNHPPHRISVIDALVRPIPFGIR
jgi:hypothetical protein